MVEKEKLLILPGGSVKNKGWAEATEKDLSKNFLTEVVYWQHWTSGSPENDWLQKEATRIKEKVGKKKVYILAKSIGTAVACLVISSGVTVDKLILCGLPLNDLQDGDRALYEPLKSFPVERMLCLQNENDPHGSYLQVKDFLASLNPSIRLISKPRSDHEYPYSSDFLNFLTA